MKKILNMNFLKKHAVRSFGIITALLTVGMSACSPATSNDNTGNYNVYYTDGEGFKLTSKEYHMQKEDIIDSANELISEMNNSKASDNAIPIKPAYVDILQVNYNNDNQELQITFSDSYLKMSNITEALYRTAMVKTLSQIPNVSYISFYIGDNPIVLSGGSVLNNMTASQYVTTDSDKIYEYSHITATLYFADKYSNKLVRYSDDIAYTQEKSLEELVVNRLIKGTDNSELRNTIPAEAKLLGISKNGNTCFVAMENLFSNELETPKDLTIYSIVNSLCELKGTDKVRFIILGNDPVNDINYIDFTYNSAIVK
ncbi:GerMN domain-containing protein [Howardella ureilytica]